jgi:hypothetical protein
MRFFNKYFRDTMHISDATGEAHVRCPFPHQRPDGQVYMESTASAHINTSQSVFHCKNPSCPSRKNSPKGGLSEAGFMAHIQGITYGEAVRLLIEMEDNVENTDEWATWQENLKNSVFMMTQLEMLGLEGMEDKLRLGYKGNGIVFPVFIYGEYMGACDYNPDPPEGMRKAVLDKGMGQAIFPFDLWREDERDTYLCAGFKDAAIARKHGLNAITFTHGEGSFPKLYKRSFKGRKVYICYDNDQGGKDGANRTAALLKESGAFPFVVDLSLVCAEHGQDIHDFFTKYEKTSEDLERMAAETAPFTEEQCEKERNAIFPLVTLEESTSGSRVGQILSSRVTVVTDYTETYRVPEIIEFEKVKDPGNKCTMYKGQKVHFALEERNLEDLLRLADNSLKEAQIEAALKVLAGINPKEEGVAVRKLSWVNVHKATVTDDFESEILDESTLTEAYSPMEMMMYSVGDQNRMKNGEKYRLFYKAVAHPLQAMKIVGVVTKIETSDTSVNKFKVTDNVRESLKCFQVQEGETVKQKMEELFQRSKAIIGAEANRPVFFATELFYHTPLSFYFSANRIERAYLEVMVVGESRTAKSQTARSLLKMYRLGTFASLKNATKAGLIGGSQATGAGYKTRLGVIPRNHKGAVILEEFSGADPGFLKAMTDIRSSNIVKIERVSGTTTAPAKVRMLTLSNVKPGTQGTTLPMKQYPSGVRILLDLVGAAEDIARYDFFVLKDEGKYIAPNTPIELDHYEAESYMNRIRWIWSRKPEQVALTEETRNYIIECADNLNKKFSCHIQFFGREAWKKLARTAIAVAACVCSTDDGENLKVTEEHVSWAVNFLEKMYDNELFKLRRYVEQERSYSTCDTTDVNMLQGIYNRNAALVNQLDMGTEFSQNQLMAISGLERDDFAKIFSRLFEGKFIQSAGEKYYASVKFRTALRHVDRTKLKRVGS